MREKAIRNTLVQSLGLIASFAERVVVVALLVRFWGTAAFASWSAILALTTMLSIAELSLNIHFGNRWQKLQAAGEAGEFQRLLGVSLFVYAALGLTLALFAGLLVASMDEGFALFIKANAFSPNEVRYTFILLALAQISHIAASSVSQVFRGRGDFALGQATDVGINIITAVAAIVTVTIGGDPIDLASTYLFMQTAVRWLVLRFVMWIAYPSLRISFSRPKYSDLKAIAGSLRWLSMIQVSSVLLAQGPIIILLYLGASPESLVAFITGRTFVNFVRTFSQFAGIGVAVEIANSIHTSSWASAWPSIAKGAGFLQVMTGVGVGGLFAFSAPLMVLWTGDSTVYNALIVAALCLPLALTGGFNVLQNSLLFADEARRYALIWIWLVLSSLGCGFIGYNEYGSAGFALGLALAELVSFTFLLPFMSRGLMPLAIGWRAMAIVIGACAATIGYYGGLACLHLIGSVGWRLAAAGSLWAIFVATPVLMLAAPRTVRTATFGWVRSILV